MKKSSYILLLIIIGAIAFLLGYLLSQPTKLDSCKSAYENLKKSDLCGGKFEEFWGTDDVIGNVDYFDFDWNENNGTYGEIKDALIGPNRRCFQQGNLEYIESGIHKSLIDCFANDIQIENGILKIQCGCFYE